MSYAVKEIYATLQGEGANTGRVAVFLRFAGCNLWTGRERDRARATCRFCDTDFVGTDGPGGGRFADAEALADAVAARWPATAADARDASPRSPVHHRSGEHRSGERLVVCTGGEPALQLDHGLVGALHARRFTVAVETNGTRPLPPGLDWVCVSPKAGTVLVTRSGDELKLVVPQPGVDPADFEALEFRHFFLQPLDVADVAERAQHVAHAIRYCLEHPRWRLSVQTHKLLGIA